MNAALDRCLASPACALPLRRLKLLGGESLNGIDYVEVGEDGTSLCVHLFGAIPQGLGVANVRIEGGDRITGLKALSVTPETEPDLHDDPCLRVMLDRQGDHTAYCLCLVDAGSGADPATWQPLAGFDPRHACTTLRFRLDCGRDLDCAAAAPCVPEPAPGPAIDYLARDFEGFRQMFLDRLAVSMPSWKERHIPDIGIALVEVLAYTADYLAYYQDAVATEAYLDTSRRRISVRRHARLVDYVMHEGCNARAFVTIAHEGDDFDLVLGDTLLLAPPADARDAKPGAIDPAALAAARTAGATVYAPMVLDGQATRTIVAAHSTIHIYTWGDELCCLHKGATRATLVDGSAPNPDGGGGRALKLAVGDFIVFEEVLGIVTGNPADADPAHRQVVRLTAVEPSQDPLDGTPLVDVTWDACDTLTFDLCLSIRRASPDCSLVTGVSVVRGNVLLVDHGDDGNTDTWTVPGAPTPGCCHCEGAVVDVTYGAQRDDHVVPGTPLTFAEAQPAGAPVCKLLQRDPRQARPGISVASSGSTWAAQGDLLSSAPDDRQFVVEIDDEARTHLRFGDGANGRRPQAGDVFTATPRLGNGPAGNVGADSIIWIASRTGTLGLDLRPRNPIAATGGTAAETLAEVKAYAPGAFRAVPLRAIVPADYAAFAQQVAGVQGASCAMAWTGSGYEARVSVDPLGTEVMPVSLAPLVRADLWRYRRIGHDVAVVPARYVPVLVEVFVCVLPDFIVAHVKAALIERFGNRRRSDGTLGFFHPDRLNLGAPVLASAIIAQAQAVTGVAHVELRTLVRQEIGTSGDIPADGILHLAPDEVAQADNDPDHPDHGRIAFTFGGGR
ncbi:putative baseplate assembly protein [Pinirhizobacter sp.]|uniref:putative baseplate assembly protein n=1 Tax=Pinirhizobacter sp. TaxID=2950432 RepID=UPI002F401C4C